VALQTSSIVISGMTSQIVIAIATGATYIVLKDKLWVTIRHRNYLT